MVLGYFLPFHISYNIEPLGARGAAASILNKKINKVKEYKRHELHVLPFTIYPRGVDPVLTFNWVNTRSPTIALKM